MCCRTGASSSPTAPPHCWASDAVRRAYLRRGLNADFHQLIQILPQQLVFGVTLGMIYGLIALGYTMVYGVLFMINFAHGDVFMIGAYIGWALLVCDHEQPDRADAIRSSCCR